MTATDCYEVAHVHPAGQSCECPCHDREPDGYDEPIPSSRETCWFWDSRTGTCHYEMLVLGCKPCAGCPEGD